MIKTKLFSALLASTMVLAPLTPHAFAAGASFVSETISPRYAIDCTPISRLTISGTKGICTSTLQSGVVKSISAEQTLEKFWGLWVWNEVEDAHWTKTVNAKSLSMSNYCYRYVSENLVNTTKYTLPVCYEAGKGDTFIEVSA